MKHPFEASDVTVIRTLIQIILNGLSQDNVSWFGIAKCFEKCADIARKKAKQNGELDTKYKPMQWEGREWDTTGSLQISSPT
jgi:hypothetical protein